MDDFVAMVQAKLGPMTFGAIFGFVLQVLIFRPTNWILAAERAVAAIVCAFLFTQPLMRFMEWMVPGLLERDMALTTSAALLALGGVELVQRARKRFIKTVGGDADE